MFLAKLSEFAKDTARLNDYTEGMSLLVRSGVLNLLKMQAQVRPVPVNNPNYVSLLAGEAQRSAGFNEALDTLVYFRELFIYPKELVEGKVTPDFGGTERAVAVGDLTQEEADGLKSTG